MATATDYAAPAVAIPGPRPWWRGRPGLVVGVVDRTAVLDAIAGEGD